MSFPDYVRRNGDGRSTYAPEYVDAAGRNRSTRGLLGHLGHRRGTSPDPNGFVTEDLVELQPSEDATTAYGFVNLDWARKWPTEEVWKARKE